jgi:hypothetical protein
VESLRSALQSRALAAARQKLWPAAAADYAEIVKLQPRVDFTTMHAAVLMLMADDHAGYRRICQQMLGEFRNTNNVVEAERTAQAWLIGDEPKADLGPAVALADFAVQQGKNHQYYPYFLFTRGLADYRQGRYASALDWFAQSRKANAASYQIPNPELNAKNFLFESMSLARLDRGKEAAQVLETATSLVRQKSSLATEPLHVDWLMCQVALKEAEKVVKAAPGQK